MLDIGNPAIESIPVGVRVLLVQPGAHRTNIVASAAKVNFVHQLIPDYEPMRIAGLQKYKLQSGKQPGDPVRAMSAVVDVVRGEGLAAGKEMPLWFVLGTDAEDNLREYMAERLQNLDEWTELTRSATITDEPVVLV